jgi:signal transduction histidine kinase
VQRPAGLRRKIWTAFILQVAAISFATVLGVYVAGTVLESVLIKQALKDETGHYLGRWRADPHAAVPDTYNMHGYLVPPGGDGAQVPAGYRHLKPGYHRLPQGDSENLVYVSDSPAGRLLLVFNQRQVNRLAFLFGLVPLTLVLLIIYLTAWITYRASRRALSPVIALANTVRRWDPKQPDLDALLPQNLPTHADGDVEALARALHGFASRLEDFVERERNFTRDASHELRSPLTVIRIAADVLLEQDLGTTAHRSVGRIRRAARDMEALIESFLILAREADTGLPEEDFLVNDVVRDEIEGAQALVQGKPVELALDERARFVLHASPRAVGVLVGNLVRNACLYTVQGRVTVTVAADRVVVADTGIGMEAAELAQAFQPFYRVRSGGSGHGIGLNIVKRLSERFDWPVSLDSEPGVGTTATVRFPAARSIGES